MKRLVDRRSYGESFSFMNWFLRHGFTITFICFLIVFINITFHPFSNEQSTTIQPQPAPAPQPTLNTDGNMTITNLITSTFSGGMPWWFTVLIVGIPAWMIWKIFRRSSFDI
jgi:hypothetical protein